MTLAKLGIWPLSRRGRIMSSSIPLTPTMMTRGLALGRRRLARGQEQSAEKAKTEERKHVGKPWSTPCFEFELYSWGFWVSSETAQTCSKRSSGHRSPRCKWNAKQSADRFYG